MRNSVDKGRLLFHSYSPLVLSVGTLTRFTPESLWKLPLGIVAMLVVTFTIEHLAITRKGKQLLPPGPLLLGCLIIVAIGASCFLILQENPSDSLTVPNILRRSTSLLGTMLYVNMMMGAVPLAPQQGAATDCQVQHAE